MGRVESEIVNPNPPASFSAITGGGSAGQIAYWMSGSGITSDAALTWDGTTLGVDGDVEITGDLTVDGIIVGTLNVTDLVLAGVLTLDALDADTVPYLNASNELVSSAVTPTELGYLSGVSSAIQTQLDAKQASGNYITALTGDVTAAGPGSVAATIANSAVTSAKMANMAEATIKGRAAGAGTGVPVDLTATQATAILNIMVGDSGAGGIKGLVPAPGVGDANNFLRGDGTWVAGAAFAAGDLTSATTGVTVTGGTSAVNGAGTSITIQTATGAQPGLLSAADWTTFNGKQAAGNYITALTGDVTASGPGSVAATIANDAVTTVKILDANVTTAKIANSAVTATQLASDAVTTVKILDLNVTTAKIANSAVTATQLASDAVTTAKILDANVTTAKLANNSVTAGKLAAPNTASASVGAFSMGSGGQSSSDLLTITASGGRPMQVMWKSQSGAGNTGYLRTAGTAYFQFTRFQGGVNTVLHNPQFGGSAGGDWPLDFTWVDYPSAGTVQYYINMISLGGTMSSPASVLSAVEL